MRAGIEVYSLQSPWGRAYILAEMRDSIANLQSVYKRLKRVYSDGSECPSDVFRRTARRDPQRQSLVGSLAPNYLNQAVTAPANKITCPLSLYVAVVQNTLHVKASTTLAVHQRLRWKSKTPFHLESQKWSALKTSTA